MTSYLIRHVVPRYELQGQGALEAVVLVAAQVPRPFRDVVGKRAAVLVEGQGPVTPARLLVIATARVVTRGGPVAEDILVGGTAPTLRDLI